MDIHYTRMTPTKNTTLLVDTTVPRPAQAAVAKLLLQSQPSAEQVGFLEPSACARMRLQMMGGEFSSNAAMALAALLCQRDGLTRGQSAEVPLEVSGAEGILRCRIAIADDHCRGAVAMPRPDHIGETQVAGISCPTVFFPGIAHCIVPAGALRREVAQRAVAPLCRRLGMAACGILLFDEEDLSFTPLVHVASTNTTCWVRSCGSGNAALAAWLSHRAGEARTLSLRQPGGTMDVSALWRGRITTLAIAGIVDFGSVGALSIPCNSALFTKKMPLPIGFSRNL